MLDLGFQGFFLYHLVKKEPSVECQFMEILYVTGWGFLVCSSCSQLEGLCSSPECNERTSLVCCGTWKSLHLYGLKQLLNDSLLCSTFLTSTLNLSIFFPPSSLFALALSPVAISSAGTNLTPGFLEHHVLPEANRLWEIRLLTIYQHSQRLAVPFQAHRPPVTWVFIHIKCACLLLGGVPFWLLRGMPDDLHHCGLQHQILLWLLTTIRAVNKH